MGGCYSAYASSRKLRGRLGNLSFVLPVTERDAANAKLDGSGNGGDASAATGATEAEDFVAKTTSAEFARRYVLGKELGRGEFGVTRRCKDAATSESLACKTIRRHRRGRGRAAQRKHPGGAEAAAKAAAAAAAAHAADVRREVAIMRRMSSRGGAAVVRLREAREDTDGAVHLVMELCEGGELFDRIVARGHYSERAAAKIFRTIVDVIKLCHSIGVMHRDLKPENFLFANKSEDSPLKVIDFGLSVFFNPGDRFTEVVGSAYYMAPEVLKRSYGQEVDVWSAGVILYILLCGVPPFWGDNDEKIAQAILRGGIDFNREPWPRVSANAKDLIRRMLDPDPNTRLTATQVVEHPWLKKRGHGAERVAWRGGPVTAAAILGDEQVQEEGAGRGGSQHAGGGAGQVRADVPPHGQGQERQPVAGGAHGGPPHQRPARAGVRDQDAARSSGHGRERDAGLRRVRDGVAAPQEDDQRRVPGVGVPLLRQGWQRLHRARRAQARAGAQRAVHPRDHPRRRHRQGRTHQLPGVRAHDEVGDGLEERVTALLASKLQHSQPEALQRSLFCVKEPKTCPLQLDGSTLRLVIFMSHVCCCRVVKRNQLRHDQMDWIYQETPPEMNRDTFGRRMLLDPQIII